MHDHDGEAADDGHADQGRVRVIELGAGWRDEPTFGPNSEVLLQVLAG